MNYLYVECDIIFYQSNSFSFFRSNSDDPSLNQKYELSDSKNPSTSNKSIEPIPQLVINSEEISLTSQDISKNFNLTSPNQSYNDPSEIRRRSSSLGHRFDGNNSNLIFFLVRSL